MSNLINEHVDFSYKNATLVDPFLTDISKVTLNKNQLPLASDTQTNRLAQTGTFSGKVPPEYITAKIELYYAGKLNKTIPILFPESASEALGTNYLKENPVGSASPLIAFGHSSNTTINISFVALADYLPQGYTTLESYLDAIRSLTKPQYTEDFVKGPEVRVHLANLYFEGVCDSVNIEYQNVYGNGTYSIANISCQFTKSK